MTEQDRILDPAPSSELPEEDIDWSLRPQTLAEYVGQPNVKGPLQLMLSAAKMRGECMEHVLFSGPPGLGKTTLAHIIAHEMGVPVKVTSGPAIDSQRRLASLLLGLNEGEILFIDEIHRLPKIVEESLYPAMEDFQFDVSIGQGNDENAIRLPLKRFTLIGATTRQGQIQKPLRDRFGASWRLDLYTEDEISQIVERSARLLNLSLAEAAVSELSRRSRGTPRIANRLLRRVRDYAQVHNSGVATIHAAQAALEMLGIDEMGLDAIDRRILSTIIGHFRGGPVGLKLLSTAMSEEIETIEDVYEPYLVQKNFLIRTPRGRVATDLAYTHLNLPPPPLNEGFQARLL